MASETVYIEGITMKDRTSRCHEDSSSGHAFTTLLASESDKAKFCPGSKDRNQTTLPESREISGERTWAWSSIMGKDALVTYIDDMDSGELIDQYPKRNRGNMFLTLIPWVIRPFVEAYFTTAL